MDTYSNIKGAKSDIQTYDLGPDGYCSNEHDHIRGPVVVATPSPTPIPRKRSTASTASIANLDPKYFPYLTRQIARCDPSPDSNMFTNSSSADTFTNAPEAEGGNAGLVTQPTSIGSSTSALPRPPNPIYSTYGIQRPKQSRKKSAHTAVRLDDSDGAGRWPLTGSPLIQSESAKVPVPCRRWPRWFLDTLTCVAVGIVVFVVGFGLVYGLTRKSRNVEIKEFYEHIPERNRHLLEGLVPEYHSFKGKDTLVAGGVLN